MKLLSFVIPVFKNEGTIKPTYDRIRLLFEKELSKYNYEFVFIDDGSDDNSLSEMLKLREVDKKVKIISFSRNFGQVAAIIAGMKECTGDAAVNISADLQDPPELIVNMVKEWEQKVEIVICTRISREDSIPASIASRLFYSLMRVSNKNIPAGGFDYLLMGRKAINEFNLIDDRNRFFQGDVLWLGFTTKFIPYKRMARTEGESQWTLFKKIKYFIDGLIYTSYLPIRFMSFLGLVTSLCGLLYACIVVVLWFYNQTPFTGYAPIIIIQLFVSGLIMVMLGMIGEYLWRAYDTSRGRQQYIIREKYISENTNHGN